MIPSHKQPEPIFLFDNPQLILYTLAGLPRTWGWVLEHIIYYLSKICDNYKLDSCADASRLLSYNLPYNLLSIKLSQLLNCMAKEAKKKGLDDIAETLNALSIEAREAGVYDI